MSSNRQAALHAMLQELKLTTMAASCAELALKAAKEGVSHEAFLYELAQLECERRTQRRIERRLAQSGLPREKTFATFSPRALVARLAVAPGALAYGHLCRRSGERWWSWVPRASGKVTRWPR